MDKYQDLKSDLQGYRGVIFDLDETLVNLNVDWQALRKRLSEITLKETGRQVEYTPLDSKIHKSREESGEHFFLRLLDIVSDFELKEEKYELNHELISLLESLEGKKIAIYSMNTEKCVKNFIEKYLKRKPDIVVSKDNCLEPKPSDKDLKKILNEWGLLSEEVVYIGNSESDRLSGEKAGIKTHIISF